MTRECVSSAGNWWCRHPKAGVCLGPSGDSMSGCDRVGRRKVVSRSQQELARRGPADHFPAGIEEGTRTLGRLSQEK